MNRLVFVLPLIALAVLVAAFGRGLTHDPKILPSMLIDKPLPQFARPGIQPGAPGFATGDFRGEPKLLNVWASWCVSCKVEHPVLMQLKADGVPIYGLAWKDRAEDAQATLAQSGDPFARTAMDFEGRTAIDLGVTGAPETFVVDKHGRVRYKQIGPITADVWEEKLKPLMAKLRSEA
jgi:cytochrome c biogenesis protein CcmG/thiol:disulfide interchange protein DsbE